MYNKLLYLVIVLCLISCNSEKKNNVKESEIELSPISNVSNVFSVNLDSVVYEDIKLSDFFKKISYIPLETNKNSLLGRISQFYMKGDTIFILDATIAKSVVMFNKQGKYLGNVGKKGEGPEEYIEPVDFGVTGDTLYVFDNKRQRILLYTLPDLKYNSSISLKYDRSGRSRYMCMDKTHIFTDIYYPGTSPSYLLHEIDNESKILNRWLSVDEYNRGYFSSNKFTGESFFTKTSNGIRYKHIASDSIMRIENGEIYPYLVFKYKDRPQNVQIEKEVESNNDILSALSS